MSLASQLQSLATRIGTEFKTLRTELAAKIAYPVSGGSIGHVLTKTNAVVGNGSTQSWQPLPARSTPAPFFGGTSGVIFSNPDTYKGNDLYLDWTTGKLWYLQEDIENGNVWVELVDLALKTQTDRKITAMTVALGG